MSDTVEIKDLADIITAAMAEYSEDVNERVKEAVDTAGKAALKSLKTNTVIPVCTGKYRKSFKLQKNKEDGVYKVTVYSSMPQLTQLLERSHVMPQGGRSKAYPHWSQAQAVVDESTDKIGEELAK